MILLCPSAIIRRSSRMALRSSVLVASTAAVIMGSGSGSDASPPPAPTPSKPAHSVAEFEEAVVAGLFTGRKPTNSKLPFSNVTQSASPLIHATLHMNRYVSDTVKNGRTSLRDNVVQYV